MELQHALNEHEAAKVLGVAVQTLRNWRHVCRGPAYLKYGRRVVYEPQGLQQFKEASKIDPESRATSCGR